MDTKPLGEDDVRLLMQSFVRDMGRMIGKNFQTLENAGFRVWEGKKYPGFYIAWDKDVEWAIENDDTTPERILAEHEKFLVEIRP